jgi:NDP-sugar pyrophosphorylase family protein
VARVADSGRYGSVELDGRGKIVEFLEKTQPNGRGLRGSRQINAGVYIFEARTLNGVRARRPSSLERDVFPRLAARGKMFGLVTDGYFIDIGIPEDLRRAQRELREW